MAAAAAEDEKVDKGGEAGGDPIGCCWSAVVWREDMLDVGSS